jgi:hypothetical protein
VTQLARCPIRACPWRWRTGGDRPCSKHAGHAEAAEVLAAAMGIDYMPPRAVWQPREEE